MKKINFNKKIEEKKQAVFVIIYASDAKSRFDGENQFPMTSCLMINRWDGSIGFLGGKVEEGDSFEKTIRREVKEEIGHNFNLKLEPIVAHDIGPITTHAYAAKTTYRNLKKIQKDTATHAEIGVEVTGVFLPHLFDYTSHTKKQGGIVNLLKAQMAPSVREELIHFLLNKKILNKNELNKICKTAGYLLSQLLK